MSSKPLLPAALVALSLGLVACGGSGSDSSSHGEIHLTMHGTVEVVE